jgi:hypothetical protein
MKRTFGALLGLLLSCGFAAFAAGQEQSQGMHTPPKVLVISREFVKPGHGGVAHEKSESAFVQAMSKANWPVHYIAMNSLSGKNRSLFFTGYDSMEAWEKDNAGMMKNAALSTALDQASVADGNLLDAMDQAVFVYDEDMSLRAPVDIAHMRYMEIQVFRVKPGHGEEWHDAVKMVKAAYEKSIPEAHWAMFHLVYGGAVGTYAVMTPLKSLAETDAMMGNDRKFAEAMGEDGLKKLTELEAASVESRERNVFAFNPRMSYAPPDWVKADPDFWQPKAMKAAAAGAKKTTAAVKPTAAQ